MARSKWGLNDPTEGDRTLVTDPWNADTSPFTWVGDGSTTYNTTRGNNGIAQNNPSGGSSYLNNFRPQSSDATWVYDYDQTAKDPATYVNASITQLFYTANKYHDLLYLLGFNEPAGNFQVSNNGKGGKANDSVILSAQDGAGTDNADFSTPPDGQNGRMRMYLWDFSTPKRDCTFEAGVILHEYTHGRK
jgi:extracellular elastinolytic metalloproteinase